MNSDISESSQKMRDNQVKGLAICDTTGFTTQAEGTLKDAVMSHATQAISLLHKLDDVKGTPYIKIETGQGQIHILEQDGRTIVMHK